MEEKNLSNPKALTSETIKYLRFPLAVMVVYIHSFGQPSEVNLLQIEWSSFDMVNFYDILRVTISRILCHCAVPIFFLFSGYLFFQNLQTWNRDVWLKKIKSRYHTLFIPYIIWISFYIIRIIVPKMGGVILNGKPFSDIAEWITKNHFLHMYWDSNVWCIGRESLFGFPAESTGPILVPFWFMRDLIVAVTFAPLIWYLITKTKGLFIAILLFAVITGTPTTWHGFGFCSWFCFGSYFAIKGIEIVPFIQQYKYVGFTLLSILLIPSVLFQGLETKIGNIFYPLLIISLVITVISVSSKFVASGNRRLFMRLSNTTFFIFAAHLFILPYTGKIVHKLTSFIGVTGDIMAYIIIPLFTTIICVFLCRFLQKYLPTIAKVIGCR